MFNIPSFYTELVAGLDAVWAARQEAAHGF